MNFPPPLHRERTTFCRSSTVVTACAFRASIMPHRVQVRFSHVDLGTPFATVSQGPDLALGQVPRLQVGRQVSPLPCHTWDRRLKGALVVGQHLTREVAGVFVVGTKEMSSAQAAMKELTNRTSRDRISLWSDTGSVN